MADRKITDLTALAAGSQATGDLLTIVDVSESAAADKNKKITVENLFKGIPGNVGIGDSAPDFDLVIKGGSNTNENLFACKDSDGTKMVSVEQDSSGNGRLLVFDTSGNNDVLLHTNGNSFFNGGNVGIGTSSPTQKLSLENGTFKISGTSTFASNVEIGRVDGDNNLAFATGGTERMRIDSSGRVGIGTTSISNKLEVDGGSAQTRLRVSTTGTDADEAGIILANSGKTAFNDGIEIAHGAGKTNFNDLAGEAQMTIDVTNSRVGIGTSSPEGKLSITHALNSAYATTSRNNNFLQVRNSSTTSGCYAGIEIAAQGAGNDSIAQLTAVDTGSGNTDFVIGLRDSSTFTERMRIDTSGRVGINTTSFADSATALVIKNGSSSNDHTLLDIVCDTNESARVRFSEDGSTFPAEIRYNTFGNDLLFTVNSSERMRITSGGDVYIGQTSGSYASSGHIFGSGGQAFHINSGDTVLLVNRQSNDGELVRLSQDGATEGTISVSGSTVSYNGGHLARWSQLASGAERTEILRGSVLSNLDEMCEWGEEDNEQLNRMKVSDVEGDVNVAGVFQAWDDDDDTYTNDFYCAMTGDFVIRIAQGTTVARGDLLMSAGDGTAKPQDDDIVRSKTIAKVTSTTVSTTYADGSYCVPCVLMAC